MNNVPTVEIETPVSHQKILVKEWITGRDREFINEPMLAAIDATPRVLGNKQSIEIGKLDLSKLTQESDHREITTFVVSIDGNSENILDAVLNMNEQDTDFIKSYIKAKSRVKKNVDEQTI